MSIYQSMPLEEFDGSVANRFTRDYTSMATTDTDGHGDDRKGRQLDEQSIERQGRLYVDPETLVSETGQDAQLEVNEYGTTIVGQDRYVRPEGAVETNDEAVAAGLVPEKFDIVDGTVEEVPVEEEPEAPTDPEPTEPEVTP